MISVCFQGRPFNITVIQVYVPTSNAEEAEVEWFYEDLQDLIELTPPDDVLFIVGNWNAKVGSKGFGLGVQNCSLLALNPGHNLGSYGGFKEKKINTMISS